MIRVDLLVLVRNFCLRQIDPYSLVERAEPARVKDERVFGLVLLDFESSGTGSMWKDLWMTVNIA